MNKRVHERERVLWRWEDLHRLEAEGAAKRYPDLNLWVVKRPEGGQVAVRDNQVLIGDDPDDQMTLAEAAAQQEAEIWAENAWLRHAENAGWEDAEMERQIEAERGVIPFDEALRQAEREYKRQEVRDENADLLARFGIGGG